MDKAKIPNRDYTFSVVMAVYKVEEYLSEAIESLLKQDIGFEEHIQLILIDDGSPDRSGEICDRYAEKYPDNIVALHKENGGVSSARNLGLEYVKGKYVNFMDSDDLLSENTMSDVALYFDIWGDKTDIISIPFEFFERMTGRNIPHNRKFANGNRVIDLMEEYSAFQFSLGAAFIRTEAISEMHFDETLVLSEDAKELYKLFLKKPFIGLAGTATYYYRKRATSGSAVDSSVKNPTCYAHHMKQHYLFMIRNYIDHLGYVPKFVQYAVMYDLQWKFRQKEIPEGILTDSEIKEYLEIRKQLLSYIEDEIIWSMIDLTPSYRLFVLREKHGEDCKYKIENGILKLYYTDPESENDVVILEFPRDFNARYDTVDYRNKLLHIEGSITLPMEKAAENTFVLANAGGRVYRCELFERSAIYCCGEPVERCYGFSVSIPFDENVPAYNVSFSVTYDRQIVRLTSMTPGDFTPFSIALNNSFYFEGDRAMTFKNGAIKAVLCGRRGMLEREKALQEEIKNRGFHKANKICKLRTLVRLYRLIHKKPVWLISDRQTGADDNGEAFFRFIKKNRKIKSFFVIGKDHKKKGRRLGRTLTVGSLRHQMYTLIADRVISSQIENVVLRITEFNSSTLKDLYSPCRFVFLQHGITKNEASGVFNKPAKDISLFITSAKREKDSIATPSYGYTDENVALTGMARFDRLYSNTKKIITVMPTWRTSLATKYDFRSGTWIPAPDAADSDFFRFYNSLLGDERLLAAARANGYKISLVPHPNLRNMTEFFKFDKELVRLSADKNYRDVFAESALIMTDYSSAPMDFSLLKKPTVYCQFDKESFFSGAHTVKRGYFDDEIDGFGEVVYDLDSAVELLISYIENGCKMKEEYSRRVDDFFAFGTEGNCQRIYDAIITQKPIE